MKLRAGWIEINHELSGEGTCLALIHGFTDNLTMWYNQLPVFSEQLRVLTCDVRGHGETQTPDSDFSMELLADDLHALLETLGIERTCLLGYSMGGRIALQFALEHPEMTAGLVFANSGVMGSDAQPTQEEMAEMAERREQMLELFETGDIEAIADAMTERSVSPGFRDRDPAAFQKYKDVKLQNDPGHYLAIMRAMVQAAADPPDLRRLECPVLIIAGERDGFMSVDVARSMERAIRNVTVTMLPTGHAAAIEAPEAFNRAVLDFAGRL